MFIFEKSRSRALFASAAAALLGLTGCEHSPEQTTPTTNQEINYDVLFHRNSCEVGRFHDGGNAVYVALCPNGSAQTKIEVNCGKGCTRPEQFIQATAPQAIESGPAQ